MTVRRLKCPRCATIVEVPEGSRPVCTSCGYGNATPPERDVVRAAGAATGSRPATPTPVPDVTAAPSPSSGTYPERPPEAPAGQAPWRPTSAARTADPDPLVLPGMGDAAPQAKTPTRTVVLVSVLMLACFVPAAAVGTGLAMALAEATGVGGFMPAIVALVVAAILLGLVGAGTFSLSTRFPTGSTAGLGLAAVALGGLSVWLFASFESAREGVFVVGATAVALILIGGFMTLMSPKT